MKDYVIISRKNLNKLTERRVLELVWAYVCGLLTIVLVWGLAMLNWIGG